MKFFYTPIIVSCLVSVFFHNASAQKNVDGEWGDPIAFGIVPVAVANLPDGRLLTWSSQFRNTFIMVGDGATFSQYFDPFGGPDGTGGVDGHEFTINTDHDMFCPGINNLPDGRILSAGGTSSERTSIFDPMTGLWSVAAEMNIPRGYQGNVTLQDGNVFTIGGSWNNNNSNDPSDPFRNGGKDAEVWSPSTGWITLPNIEGEDIFTNNDLTSDSQGLYRVDNHVWLWPAPNGYLFHAGPSEMMHWIDVSVPGGQIVEAGIRQDIAQSQIDAYSIKGNTVMFDTGKILKTGGAPEYGPDYTGLVPARNNSFVIDLNGVDYDETPGVTFTGNMNFPRTMHNSTVLPNGEVVVTGGLRKAALFTDDEAVFEAEIFNEATGWRTVAGMAEARTYHSVAILMIDGRVFVGGGGLCDNTPQDICINHFNAEIYSPPYLFDDSGNLATRPVITSVGSGNTGSYGEEIVGYNSSLNVTTDVDVEAFSLIRFSAATHSTNNEQRRIPLTTTTGTSHTLSIPDRNLLPPGYYMLFAMDTDGVPSIAKTLKIGDALPLGIENPNAVIHLKFDEPSGTSVADSSGNNNNGTVVEREDNGSATTANDHSFVPGLFGNAIEMTGKEFQSNSIIEIPNSPSILEIQDKITISAWVYRNSDAITSGGKVANVGIFSHNYPFNFFGFHNTLYKWSFYVNNGQPYPNNSMDLYSGYAPLEGWNHIVGTYDGSVAKLYANGVEIASKEISANIRWINDGTDYSKVTVSGFYDNRPLPSGPGGNESGITDEIDGRIDELIVYKVALGPEEVANLYAEGVAQNNPDVAVCEGNYIEVEYKVNDGQWLTNEFGLITVEEGDEVFLRAKDYPGQYFATTQIIDGPTYNSNNFGAQGFKIDTGSDGFIDADDEGIYVLTTPEGCPTAFKVDVVGGCSGVTNIYPQYRLNCETCWFSANGVSSITVQEGDELLLSILPDSNTNPEAYPASIKLPNGTIVPDAFTISPMEPQNSGTYEFISAQGCSKLLEIIVEEVDCATFPLTTEYQINGGGFVQDESVVEVMEGDDLVLSIQPNNTPYSIVSNSLNGRSKPNGIDDLTLSDIELNDAGTYTLTTASGCSIQLEVIVKSDCAALGLQTQYEVNGSGSPTTGATQVTLNEGDNITLGISLDGALYTITSDAEDNNSKPLNADDLTLTGVTEGDEGVYTFTSQGGCVAQLEILINQRPTAVAASDVSSGAVPLTVQFDGSGSSDDGTLIYAWDFGDGNTSSEMSPTHEYVTEDDFVVTLTVTDAEGLEATDTLNISTTIVNEAPVASASANPTVGQSPLLVNFSSGGSTDDNGIVSYHWDFGDGTTSNQPNPSHLYVVSQTYTVTLTVTDAEGEEDTDTLLITVESLLNSAPEAVISASPLTGLAPLEVIFNSTGSTDDKGIVSYAWDFGDGTTSDEANPTHIYTQVGTFTASLTVSDEEGLLDMESIDIVVESENEAPNAVASATPESGNAPLEVSFSSVGSTDDNGIVSYSWDFGDGTSSNEANPTHTFTVINDYTVVLTVTDNEGAMDTASVIVQVSDPQGNQAPNAVASATPESGNAPLEVSFSSAGSTDDNGIVSYSWDFGDGTSSNEANPTHTFTVINDYTVVLTVTDNEGAMDTASVIVQVSDPQGNQAPNAVASATPVSGDAPLEVSFSSAGSTDDNGIVSYSWDFGDGTSSNEANPTYTFTTSGFYTVTLTVTDAEGLVDSTTLVITVGDGTETGESLVAVAPNPAVDGTAMLYIQKPQGTEPVKIALFDTMGRLIYTFVPLDVMQGSAYAVPVGTVSNGVYYIKVYYNNGEPDTVRFVVRN